MTSLQFENEILYSKSNSMDHCVQNYGKRIEELSKQLEELHAIVRIREREIIEVSGEIHSLRIVVKDGLKKELTFRR